MNHNYEQVAGSSRQWECLECGVLVETKEGVHPAMVKHRGLVAPFNPCSPDREQVIERVRQGKEAAKAFLVTYQGWHVEP